MPPRGPRGGRRAGKAPSTSDPGTSPAAQEASVDNAQGTNSTNILDDALMTDAPLPPRTETPVFASAQMGNTAAGFARAILGTSTRGGRGGSRGGAVASTSRFKPKNVRRSAAELAELAQMEERRLAGVAAANAREQARIMRGRGRGLRGRGDVMGRGRGRGALASASGLFGVVPEGLKKAAGIMSVRSGNGGGGSGGGGSGGGGSGGGLSVKNEKSNYFGSDTGGWGGSERIKREQDIASFAPHYPGEDEDVLRVDIEQINLLSDDENNVIYKGSRSVSNHEKPGTSKGGLKPIRLYREEHKERATVVNTVPAAKPPPDLNAEIQLIIDLQSSQPAGEVNEIQGLDLEGPGIKSEPGIESFLDNFGSPSVPGSSLELTSKRSRELKNRGGDATTASVSALQPDVAADESKNLESKTEGTPRCLSKKLKKKPVIQTEEDRAEYERHLEDIAILANELGSLQGNTTSSFQDADGDKNMDDDFSVEQDKKEGRLYLFQFPPVLPALYNNLTENKPRSKSEIKVEGDGKPIKVSVKKENNLSESNPKEIVDAKAVGDLNNLEIKQEAEIINDGGDKEDTTDRKELIHEEGFIGKLIVRESGRVELCWGGTSLLVGRGVDAAFLTTGVLVDGVQRGPPGGGVPEGKALCMGQIMGKFVVTPDWQKMT